MAAQESNDESLLDKGVESLKPWRRGAAWWLILGEGLVLLAVGIYVLVAPENTNLMLGWVVAAVLAGVGLIELFMGLTMRRAGAARESTVVMGVVGLVLGAVALILLANDSASFDSARIVVGIGATLFGLVGVFRLLTQRSAQIGRGRSIIPVMLLAIGVLELLAAAGVGDMAWWVKIVGILLIVVGVVLIGWSLLRRQAQSKAQQSGSPDGRPMEPQAPDTKPLESAGPLGTTSQAAVSQAGVLPTGPSEPGGSGAEPPDGRG